jgi:hypothetical protein
MGIDDKMLKSAMSGKSRAGKGDYVKYLKGGRITRNQSIKAKCYDCQGMGDSGTCEIESCSLYPYSPYANKKS